MKVVLHNTLISFYLREKVIDFFKNCSFFVSEAKYEAKHGRAFKILTSKQLLQTLPIALA